MKNTLFKPAETLRSLCSRISVAALLAAVVIVFGAGAEARAGTEGEDPTLPPFEVGERLTYDLRWGIFSAGEAVLTVNPMAQVDDEEVYHFTLTVRTSSFIDRFYKVRDQMDAFVRQDMDGSLLYLVKKEAGKHRRDVRVIFDAEADTALYSNFGKEKEPIRIFPSSFDPLAVIYAFRTMPMVPDSTREIPVADGRRASMGVGYMRERERVRVPAGNYDTVLVEPDMQDVGGVFERSDDAYLHIWFSDDEHRLPVKVSSKVAVGSFRAELVSVDRVEVSGDKEKLVLVR